MRFCSSISPRVLSEYSLQGAKKIYKADFLGIGSWECLETKSQLSARRLSLTIQDGGWSQFSVIWLYLACFSKKRLEICGTIFESIWKKMLKKVFFRTDQNRRACKISSLQVQGFKSYSEHKMSKNYNFDCPVNFNAV